MRKAKDLRPGDELFGWTVVAVYSAFNIRDHHGTGDPCDIDGLNGVLLVIEDVFGRRVQAWYTEDQTFALDEPVEVRMDGYYWLVPSRPVGP